MKPQLPLRVVTWNCMSCFPQYYETVKAIEKAGVEKNASVRSLRANMKHNIKRYENIVHTLTRHFESIQTKKLTAVVLQEVDHELLQLLKQTIQRGYPKLYIHHTTPYISYPQRQPPPHDFAYYLVTIHHQHSHDMRNNVSPLPRLKLSRCLVTVLRSCVIYNVHIPWVAPEHSVEKHEQTEKTVRLIVKHVRNNTNSVVVGDLNLSCPFNARLYQTYFNKRFYTINVFGESYKLSPENIRERKTFKALEHTPDDGCITHNHYTTQAEYTTLGSQKLPVDKTSWFLPSQQSTYPSDHALVVVTCTRHRRHTARKKYSHSHHTRY